MILATYEKQPTERKDYDVDYSPWLSQVNDGIDFVTVSDVCITKPEDTALVIEAPMSTASMFKIWVSGGTTGCKYKVTFNVNTLGGRIDQCELVFKIKDR